MCEQESAWANRMQIAAVVGPSTSQEGIAGVSKAGRRQESPRLQLVWELDGGRQYAVLAADGRTRSRAVCARPAGQWQRVAWLGISQWDSTTVPSTRSCSLHRGTGVGRQDCRVRCTSCSCAESSEVQNEDKLNTAAAHFAVLCCAGPMLCACCVRSWTVSCWRRLSATSSRQWRTRALWSPPVCWSARCISCTT